MSDAQYAFAQFLLIVSGVVFAGILGVLSSVATEQYKVRAGSPTRALYSEIFSCRGCT